MPIRSELVKDWRQWVRKLLSWVAEAADTIRIGEGLATMGAYVIVVGQ